MPTVMMCASSLVHNAYKLLFLILLSLSVPDLLDFCPLSEINPVVP